MPKLFVVAGEADLTQVAAAILGPRIGAVRRAAAVEALRRANPGMDLDRLHPGAVLTVPDEPDLAERAADPVVAALDDLLGRAATALEAAPAEADRAEEARRGEAEAMRAVIGSREIARLSGNNPQLKENVASVARDLEKQDSAAQEDRRALREAVAAWGEELKALRLV